MARDCRGQPHAHARGVGALGAVLHGEATDRRCGRDFSAGEPRVARVEGHDDGGGREHVVVAGEIGRAKMVPRAPSPAVLRTAAHRGRAGVLQFRVLVPFAGVQRC